VLICRGRFVAIEANDKANAGLMTRLRIRGRAGERMEVRFIRLRKYWLGTMLASLEDEIGGRMSLQLQMEQMPGYLVARFIGEGAAGEASEQFELIAEQCRCAKNDKLLIDTTGYDVKASTVDRFLLGVRSQIFACYRIKVAFVCRPEQIDARKFGRLVAQNRGVTVEVFTDFHAAEVWLLK